METILQSETFETLPQINWVIAALLAVFVILLLLTLFFRSFLKKINLLKKNLDEFHSLSVIVSQKIEAYENQNKVLIQDIGILKNQMREEFNLTKLSLSSQIDSLLLKIKELQPHNTDILIPRLDAYKRLWEITEIANPNRTKPLDDNEKLSLRSDLSSWYFEDGNGIFLSIDAANHLKTVIDDLAEASFETVKKNLSLLRAQLKNDIEYYDTIEEEDEATIFSG